MSSALPRKNTKQSLLDWTQPFYSPAALLFFCISVFLHFTQCIRVPRGRGTPGPLPSSAPISAAVGSTQPSAPSDPYKETAPSHCARQKKRGCDLHKSSDSYQSPR